VERGVSQRCHSVHSLTEGTQLSHLVRQLKRGETTHKDSIMQQGSLTLQQAMCSALAHTRKCRLRKTGNHALCNCRMKILTLLGECCCWSHLFLACVMTG
jgi:hypothetical protein